MSVKHGSNAQMEATENQTINRGKGKWETVKRRWKRSLRLNSNKAGM